MTGGYTNHYTNEDGDENEDVLSPYILKLVPPLGGSNNSAPAMAKKVILPYSSTWVRTTDLMVNSHTLYQLSHRGSLSTSARAGHYIPYPDRSVHTNNDTRNNGPRAGGRLIPGFW